MSKQPLNKWYQFHLATYLVAAVLTNVLVGVNIAWSTRDNIIFSPNRYNIILAISSLALLLGVSTIFELYFRHGKRRKK